MKLGPTGRGAGKQDVLIVADDITGALDTAGYFATPENPIQVWLDRPPAISGGNAIDLDTRDLDETTACGRVAEIFAGRERGVLSFKKIDSVMRGHPIAEAVAVFRAGRFRRALFAPAFPAMGRVTVDGRQLVISQDGKLQVGPALVDALSSHGIPAAMLGKDAVPGGFVVADASSDAELADAVAAFGEGDDDLYIGAGGLASVLAGRASASLSPPTLDLAICGTNHPVTLRQIAAVPGLRSLMMDGSTMQPEPPVMLVSPSNAVSVPEARAMIERSLARLVATAPRPRAVLVTGGWTLRLLLRICAASHLLCEGLYEPGVAMSRMVAGTWDGTAIVSKSGGFGDDNLLVRLFAPGAKESARGKPYAGGGN
ncbi:four-carbon acid sugar kinase family protein [Mesorhizobium sp. BH1-1-5]|uniref:four-carbon acid sugar kinase family protein n=1 Tax=Mesorhizobium sp. BH1-1-5 TaxID=2876661 RepID=UPI001CCACEF6|nr:four-carbon acid sugar kinase family protein [Mesorhizobium sp. BH1-1-5]MBZ9987403.1 four-carbon acid sugar kinase family protein [Mesorhizobium sp. BH1-1-5]